MGNLSCLSSPQETTEIPVHMALEQRSNPPALTSNSELEASQGQPSPTSVRPRVAFLSLPALLARGCYKRLPLAVLDEAVFFFPAVARRW